ncbi:FMN-dependent NADH-azoreductase [Kribbella rubisoli]|uniref:FMN dependent NADH:quinone oxidoreductase n=1 Tax=Kribbella rubisoli TaxID=3075929 RepID=A0A4Q7XKV0_9ACTN|nr:NAD(P)H-dependent oxidoreductase [Kribbella rubisoli]RZU24407.1 FMN-dependent NADH-azoreductase [Kribbella rubisoli]
MLLHLDSSANRSDESVTRRLTRLFADRWRSDHGSTGYRYRDLAADPVPPIDTAYCQLGRRSEREGVVPLELVGALVENAAEAAAWALTEPLVNEVLASSTILIGAPLYNFSLPAALKAWIDRITFPGALALGDIEVLVITSRGGAYGPGTPREGWDYEVPYLRAYFTNYGVRDDNIRFITAEFCLAGLVPRLAHLRRMAEQSLAEAISSIAPGQHATAER